MYRLRLSRKQKKKIAYVKLVIIVAAVLGLCLVVWGAWVRPAQKAADISSFGECREAGNQIQETYPEVCLTPQGRRFVNPEQAKAHEASEKRAEALLPPTDPAMLKLDIQEWKIRVPLSEKTFDLAYTYFDDNGDQRVTFVFKRLVRAGFCKSDVGVTMTRSVLHREPPYSPTNPAPVAQTGQYYYYLAFAGSPCYDAEKTDQAALVKQIAGDQSLTKVVADLLGKLQALPAE